MFSTSKKMIVTGILTLSILGAGAASVLAEEEVPSADVSVGFYSKYVWRGIELSKESLAIQPSLTVSYMGFGANLWASLDTDQTDFNGLESHKWVETDLTLSYDGAYEKLGYGVGWIYYAINDGGDLDSQEFYGTLSLDVLLAPSITIYYDTDNFQNDWYALLGISHSFALSEAISLDLGLSAGYYFINDGDPSGGDYSALHDGILSVALSIPVGEHISISPELYWSFPLSSDAEDFYADNSVDLDEDNYVYGGISASFSF